MKKYLNQQKINKVRNYQGMIIFYLYKKMNLANSIYAVDSRGQS
ncbi:hypothetical protein XBI1_120004 [Xenorhabdus bovienii str. Intermedium]|uniref:Uncharacterized protein n=1 Tax=Xenorhabdus bovienii str. Intermedium TaxID=1379677 RepID=A0A077QFA5_XENBV|nr:hypothetical protein XBI1_120004 [Xenorhabdus bovienii str. Intermedium]